MRIKRKGYVLNARDRRLIGDIVGLKLLAQDIESNAMKTMHYKGITKARDMRKKLAEMIVICRTIRKELDLRIKNLRKIRKAFQLNSLEMIPTEYRHLVDGLDNLDAND